MNGLGGMQREYIRRHHKHEPAENQCNSAIIKHNKAPVHLGNLEKLMLSRAFLPLPALKEVTEGRPGISSEGIVVDLPEGNTKDETCYFVEALIKCNLKSLAEVSEWLTVQDRTDPIDRT